MTVREFMLKKFPVNKYMDCPVPKHHWETIQEYADKYHEANNANTLLSVSCLLDGLNMTKLDELVSFILSDNLKEIRNFNCYGELVAEAKKLQREQVINQACIYESDNTTAMNCKNCGNPKWTH
jgi:hypothetical protein